MKLFCKGANIALLFALTLMLAAPAMAGHHKKGPTKKAIVLAAFGTSYPQALNSILNIKSKVEKANPGVPVKLAFTSDIIRGIWQKRQNDTAWQKANAGVPKEILYVKNPLATIANLQNEGYEDIAVQSLHIFAGEEFADLESLMIGLRSIRALKARFVPFKRMRLGRPALGMPGDVYPYLDDIAAGVAALKGDVEEAKKMDAALVYMGHGNDFYSTGIYAELQREMQVTYKYPIFVGCVEGFPNFNDLLAALKLSGKKNILMKPFMVVAGDHASNDMAGDEDDSWKVMLTKAGYKVKTELRGLGSLDAWADLYVKHLKDAQSQTHMLP
ncbi:sirohydrochlorin cobaltochelatase [Pseudodesulfovibrio sp. zrk46]|uniref:sirohydrochlorin cobaltochelatase n=1 Tax=Pseudodesulfovibrio sp. zrk46 TaxID=2725288 RepID=UPI001448B56D|nr:sirohydrochlorin cobaltochelatase [Pseudodesulfovibrio sp. zrk46]QJB58212.1 sirohydrochlorin cobaltochelatase [Pseudodesulfovibrio sp. zrk46]